MKDKDHKPAPKFKGKEAMDLMEEYLPNRNHHTARYQFPATPSLETPSTTTIEINTITNKKHKSVPKFTGKDIMELMEFMKEYFPNRNNRQRYQYPATPSLETPLSDATGTHPRINNNKDRKKHSRFSLLNNIVCKVKHIVAGMGKVLITGKDKIINTVFITLTLILLSIAGLVYLSYANPPDNIPISFNAIFIFLTSLFALTLGYLWGRGSKDGRWR